MKKNSIIGISGIILLIASLIWYSISQIWGTLNWLLMLIGIAGIAHFVFYYYKDRDKEVSHQALKKGSNVAVQIVVMLAIISMIAFVTNRRNYRADLTENNIFSLADQTTKLLEGLKKPVEIKAFFRNAESNQIKTLLDEYNYYSSNIVYEIIDPDQEPGIAKQYGISQLNSLVFKSGIKKEMVTEISEANITNAIIKVSREQDKVIYFTTGHGERSINDNSAEGLSQAVDGIRKENHLVKTINIAVSKSIPDSASVVAVIGPKALFFPMELDTLASFVENGGKLLLMLDPESPQGIKDFASKYKVIVGNNMVIDASGLGQLFGSGPGVPIIQTYDVNHAITKGFGVMSFFPYTSSVTPMSEKDGWEITELAKTSENSWADADYSSGAVSFDQNSDIQGPVTVAAIAKKNESVAAIFGDSDFAKNAYLGQQGNGNLFLNTINFLAEEEDLISIRPKQPQDSRLTLTQADVTSIFYLVVIAIPLLLVILGVVVFLKRNRA